MHNAHGALTSPQRLPSLTTLKKRDLEKLERWFFLSKVRVQYVRSRSLPGDWTMIVRLLPKTFLTTRSGTSLF